MTKLSFILLSGPGSGALHTKALRARIKPQLAELPGVDMGDAECGGWLPLWVCVVWVGEVEEVFSSFVRLQQAALN